MFSRPQTPEPSSVGSSLQQDINKTISGKSLDDKDAKHISCGYCSTNERLQTFHDLKEGDHISLAGDNFKCNISKKQFALYKHHAIVKSVTPFKNDGSEALLTLIQFISTPFSKSVNIQETEEIKMLYYDEIYRCRYRHPTHPPKTIIKRAEQLVKESKKGEYSVLTYNCEHMVRWCVNGTSKSLQVENFFSKIMKWAFELDGMTGRIARLILSCRRLGVLIDIAKLIPEDVAEIAKSKLSMNWLNASFGVLLVMVLLFLLFSIYKHYKLCTEFDKGEICSACCSRKKWEIWLEFTAYLITNGGGFLLLFLSVINWVTGLIFTGSIVLSVSSMYLAPKLWNMFKGPFLGKKNIITSLENIKKGDIVTFHHLKLRHDGIVSVIKLQKTGNGKITKGTFEIIHYALPSLTSRRRIKEDTIDIDLTKEKVWVHDYSGYSVFQPEEVIRRAKLRVGETKFKVFSNRSPHFCYWAKVNENSYNRDDNLYSSVNDIEYEQPFIHKTEDKNLRVVFIDHRNDKILSSCKIDIYEARTKEDIRAGDLIEFKYRKLSHKAICINTISMEKPSEVKVSIVHYGDSYTVVEEDVKFDLNKDTIKVHNYLLIHRFKREDIIKRARAKVGEKKYNIFTNRASHFAENNICKSKDFFITSLDDIAPGDVLIFRYWGLPHQVLVTKIIIDDGNNAMTGTIQFAHYGLEHIFATRKITVEIKLVNLLKTKLKRKGFEGYYTYQNEIAVKRAKSRVGELRFNSLYNKSSDFVFWCKVIQEPSIFVLKSLTPPTKSDRLVVVPHTGEAQEQFQKNWVKTWSELVTGSVIQVCSKKGIIEDKDEALSTIRLIWYNKSKKQIEHKQFSIDLKRNKSRIYIYWCDPRKCYSPVHVIKRAKNTSQHRQFTSELDFCKYCLMQEVGENVN